MNARPSADLTVITVIAFFRFVCFLDSRFEVCLFRLEELLQFEQALSLPLELLLFGPFVEFRGSLTELGRFRLLLRVCRLLGVFGGRFSDRELDALVEMLFVFFFQFFIELFLLLQQVRDVSLPRQLVVPERVVIDVDFGNLFLAHAEFPQGLDLGV